MTQSPPNNPPDIQPDDPLAQLNSMQAAERQAAVEALVRQAVISAPAMAALEQLAAEDEQAAVRQAALSALQSPAARRAQSTRAMPRDVRLEILEQIETWRATGQISSQQASALRLRYNFDIAPRGLSPAAIHALSGNVDAWQQAGLLTPAQADELRASFHAAPAQRLVEPSTSAPQPDSATAPQPSVDGTPASIPAARQSLQQVLFSEVSIRIALYLGGFLIVAAALILAAVLEIARLPILLSLTLACGAAALLARARLPLPSFVLFIIFASLVPIDAGVMADLLKIDGDAATRYWAVVLAMQALLLGAGTIFYRSRLFSMAAVLSLSLSGLFFATWVVESAIENHVEYYLLMIALVGLISAVWQITLKRRFDLRFIMPIYWVTHLQTLLLAAFTALITLLYVAFTYDASMGETVEPRYRLLMAAFWLIVIGYYLLSDLVVHHLTVLPFLAAGALVFTPWLLISSFSQSTAWTSYATGAAAVAVAVAGHRLSLRAPDGSLRKRYGLPLLIVSPGLFIWAVGLGFLDPSYLPAFLVLLAAALCYSMFHVQHPHLGLWLLALGTLLAAYFTFFSLPVARAWKIEGIYQAAGAGILLLLPDLFGLRGARLETHWLRPARWLGAVVIALNTIAVLLRITAGLSDSSQSAALIWGVPTWFFGVNALFLLVYALRRQSYTVGYAVSGYLFATLACWLALRQQSGFILPLSALTGALYLAGLALLLRGLSRAWSQVLRYSALALAAALLWFVPNEIEAYVRTGLALTLAGMLFFTEIHLRRGSWLELPMQILLILGLTRLLRLWVSGPALPGFDLLLASVLVLGFDMYVARRPWALTTGGSRLRLAMRIIGAVLTASCALFFIAAAAISAAQASFAFTLLSAFFLLSAWSHRRPILGYLTFAFLSGSLFYAMRAWGYHSWLGPQIVLAVLLYASHFAVAKRHRLGGWAQVLRLSGLGLAMLASFSAPFEDHGLAASLWVALAASIYAIEALHLRNVWLGFPANGLYLLAYFILLLELNVREPQYFSAGVAILGLLMHYLLVRSGSRMGAFITGLVSQFVLLGTTYLQMASTNRLSFFVMLFFQGLAVLAYGIIIRSRSLVLAPVVFIVLGVITVVLSVLSGIPTAIIIGCTGVVLLTLGIAALLTRERLAEVSERFGGWRA